MTLKAAIFHSLKQLEQQIPETWSIYGNCPICRQRLSAGGTPKEATWVCFCQTPCGILTYQLKAKENNLVYYKQEILLTGLQTWWNFQEDSRASLQWYQSWTQSNPQEVGILISIELKRYNYCLYYSNEFSSICVNVHFLTGTIHTLTGSSLFCLLPYRNNFSTTQTASAFTSVE